MENKKLMVIDGSSLLFRAFYALPLLTTKEGIYTNAMYGFLSMMFSAIDENKPDYLAVAFDKSGPTFRHKIYDDYKGTRSTPPSEIKQQFPMIKEILKAMNIVSLESDDYEADDIAGSLAKLGEEAGLDVVLLTGDRDYLQLATDKTQVVITKKGISETKVYDRQAIEDEFEISPEKLIDLKGLMGDSSDNIPGVPGIGEKTGLMLVKEYGSIENIYENIDKISGKKRKENLINNKELAFLSRELGTIVCDMDLGLDLEDLSLKEADLDSLMPLLERYEFSNFIDKFGGISQEEELREYSWEILGPEAYEELVEEIVKIGRFSFKFMVEDDDYFKDDILYMGLKYDETIRILDLEGNLDSFVAAFKRVFEDEALEKIGHSLKEDSLVLFRLGIDVRNLAFDTMLAWYLIDPSLNSYSINDIGLAYINYYGQDREEILGKGKAKKNFRQVDQDLALGYLAAQVDIPYTIEEEMRRDLEELEMDHLYYDVELALVKVLASMEFRGFAVDEKELSKLELEFSKEIDSLTQEIHQLAGSEFNINSPKQLGLVLFDDLGLPVIKKTKTGYSTNAEVLDKLKGQHDIIEKVLRYREVAKLKSTYIDGLLKIINQETGRIHSSFNQTITTTGRISSTEPNLQNIPIRTHDGRQIRRAFVAGGDHILVDADYSQIELRVLAHISGDEKMIESFRQEIDIHTKTASEVFATPLEEVDKSLRDRAKAVNFGIIYGISDYGLSQDLNIPRKEAKEYIDNYLDNYPSIRNYMEEIVDFGREEGYVETLLHRRRYIPELRAKNFNIRSFGERIALNTPIQGSAADIIKLAMVEVYRELEERGLKSQLILQVHDELIIETHKDEKEEVEKMLKDIMENVIDLRVPLLVDLKVGDSWYDTL